MKYITKRGKNFVPNNEGIKNSLAPKDVYNLSKDKIKYWDTLAKEGINWIEPWTTIYKKERGPNFSWFKEGKLNLSYNAIDRHLDKPDKTAIIFIPENKKESKQKISYFQLYNMVNDAASMLIKNGIKKGDVVAIYMPLIPEALAFMLACTRIGAIHSVVFSAFSADSLRTRIKDGNAKLLITADYYYRRGKISDLTKKTSEATRGIKIKKIVVKRKNSGKFLLKDGAKIVKPESMSSEDPLFILYTSGTTGKPKGVVHTTGGYTVQCYWSSRFTFNLQQDEVFWCSADIGWITGHTYTTYGPLLNNATTVIFEGMLDYPTHARFLEIIEENKVNVFYTAPTALRLFALEGTKYTRKFKLNSLKVLGTVGEPIDESTWLWYFNNIGKKRCPIVDTYWQTETGSAVVTSLPGHGPFIPAYAGKPFPGMSYDVIDNKGRSLGPYKKGLIVQKQPFSPGLFRGVWKNQKRYNDYFKWGMYQAGDNAFKDSSGNFRVLGRSDDIIKIAGHRLSTAEMENAISSIKGVVEMAVVSKEDKIKGEVPVAFVKSTRKLKESDIINIIVKKIGPIAKPKEVYFVNDIPKTRSGKMMRRILKTLIAGEDVKNTSTLVNPDSVKDIKELINSNK